MNKRCLFIVFLFILVFTLSGCKVNELVNKPKISPTPSAKVTISPSVQPTLSPKENEDKIISEYEKELKKLSLSNIDSISLATSKFFEYANEKKEFNDRLYDVFEKKYYEIIDKLNDIEFDIETEKADKQLDENDIELWDAYYSQISINRNGLYYISGEGGAQLDTRPGYLIYTFGRYLTEPKREYMLIENQYLDDYMVDDAGLMVSWEELSVRIFEQECFVNKYPKSVQSKIAIERIERYMYFLTSSRSILGNTPPFNSNLRLNDETKKAYVYFFKKYPESKYAKIIKGYYDILKANKFRYNKRAEEHLVKNKVILEIK